MNFFNKSLILAVMAACFVSSVFAGPKTKEELLAAIKKAQFASDRKTCLWFSSYGKFPQAIVYDSNKDEVRSILFACDTSGVDFVTTPDDFANLIPALFRTSKPLAYTFMEKKYKGFSADKMVMKAISSNDFKSQFKTPFMKAECESVMFQKWVFESVEQLEAFVKYLSKIGVVPSESKPLVVLEVKKNLEALSEEAATFLNECFNIADMSNSENQEIAKEIVTTIKEASQDAHDYATIQVGKSLRDMLLEGVDDNFNGFESKKLAKKAIMIFAVAVVIGVPTYILYKILNPLADAYAFDPMMAKARTKCDWFNNLIKAYHAQIESNTKVFEALNK